MEPKNHPIEKENDLPNLPPFVCFKMLSFQGWFFRPHLCAKIKVQDTRPRLQCEYPWFQYLRIWSRWIISTSSWVPRSSGSSTSKVHHGQHKEIPTQPLDLEHTPGSPKSTTRVLVVWDSILVPRPSNNPWNRRGLAGIQSSGPQSTNEPLVDKTPIWNNFHHFYCWGRGSSRVCSRGMLENSYP